MAWFESVYRLASKRTSKERKRIAARRNTQACLRVGKFDTLESRLALSSIPGLVYSDLRVAPHATSSPTGYAPAQVASAYGFNNVSVSGVKGDGSGQTIAIVDAFNDPNILNDLAQFDQQFGLPAPPTIRVVNENGGTALPTNDTGWSTEIALDVEWAHAMAPGANIMLVEASSAYTNDLDAALDFARNAPGVVVVSNSWGGSEYSTESSEDVHFTTPSGHTGVTFTVAAGDNGTGAEYPSSSPNVLSVGGTSLSLSGGAWSSEAVWSGGGGGASRYEGVPSYQNGLALSSRGTPDVSYDADPNTGFSVYDSYGSGGWTQVGGTSAGAPQWAALIAIADQGRAANGLSSLANAQAAIYSLSAADFHDVSSGSDGIVATAGYDLASGRGSPIANLVVADLAAYGSGTSGGGNGGGTGTTSLSAPTLSASAASTTTAKLTWNSVSSASGYRVYEISGTTQTLLGTVSSTTTTVTVSGLTARSTNSFMVEAYDANGNVADSNIVSVTQPAGTLGAPQNVTATAISSTSAQLTWSSVTGASGYRIFLVNGGQSTLLGSVGSTASSTKVTGLVAGSTDSFKVEAYNASATADSAVVTVTLPASSLLTAPKLTVTAISSTAAQLAWSAISGASGYRIYMWNGYYAVLLGTVGASTTSVQVTNLIPGTSNQFLVEAYNSTSYADSAWVSLTMPQVSTTGTALVHYGTKLRA